MGKIVQLTQDLRRPEAEDAETRLRILTIRGMLETNYDAAQARSSWEQVKTLALKQGHLALATRAEGEQGIAAFILGDTETAKKLVVRARGFPKSNAIPPRPSGTQACLELVWFSSIATKRR